MFLLTTSRNIRIVEGTMSLSHDEQLKYKSLYVKTAKQYLTELKENLSQLGTGNRTDDVIDALHIAAHALAGQSAIMGYQSMNTISSLLEKIFKAEKEKKLELSDELLTKLVNAVDEMERCVVSIDDNNQEADIEQTIKDLQATV